MVYLKTNNLLHRDQHGFRGGRGTETALAHFHELVATGRAKNYKINIVLRDVAKAFDKVWIDGLKHKIITSNIPTYLKRIVCNYLTNRNAKIKIDEHLGQIFQLRSGVPQGGCLSPTLYNFYNLEIPNARFPSQNLIYADDISQIVACRGTRNMVNQATQREINNINRYEKTWKIKTNNTKFEIIPIATNIRGNERPIWVGQHQIQMSIKGKLLGLNLQPFGYQTHISTRIAMARESLYKLFRFEGLSQQNKLKLYNAFVRSILVYPIIPIHLTSDYRMKEIQRIQNKATRWITKIRRNERKTSEYIHNTINLEPINIFTHRLAKNIWNRMENILTEEQEIRLTLEQDERTKLGFGSSRTKALGPDPVPLYK